MLLLLLVDVPSNGISVAILETGDGIALRIASGEAPITDPNFRVVARPRRRTIIPTST
jgi:hypothetical protein